MFIESDSVRVKLDSRINYKKALHGNLLWIGHVSRLKGQVLQDEVMTDSGDILVVNPEDLEKIS